jgi:hypothetical protein
MMRCRWLASLTLAVICVGCANAQEEPLGAPQPDQSLRDPEFGVIARHIGLERDVLMLQWQSTSHGYVRMWSDVTIDSSTFAPGHVNPVQLPLQRRRWLATRVTVDGKPLEPAVIAALGQWHAFRPSFSSLPGNLAATFQPEGNGLGTADDPMNPRVGDLRVLWRDLVLPPLDGLIVLQNGRWHLVAAKPAPVSATGRWTQVPGMLQLIGFISGAILVWLAWTTLSRRRR